MGPGRERGRGEKRNRDGVGTETGTEVETCREKQGGNGDGRRYGNESSIGDGSGDGNEDGIYEGEGEAKKRKKPHMTCRRDQALSFPTHQALASTRQLRSQGQVPVQAHSTKGVSESEGRSGANAGGGGIRVEVGNRDGNGVGDGNGDGNVAGDEDGTGRRTGVEATKGTPSGNGMEAGTGW